MASKRLSGEIERVIVDKGFGFIKAENGGSYFFHKSELTAPLVFSGQLQGARVSFAPEQGPKGLRAASVSQP